MLTLISQEDSGVGKAIADFLATHDPADKREARNEFRRRFLGMALEAFRREENTETQGPQAKAGGFNLVLEISK